MYQLRRNVAAMFRKYSDVTSPEVVDLLVYKGREELEVRRAPAVAGGQPKGSARGHAAVLSPWAREGAPGCVAWYAPVCRVPAVR